MESSWIRQAMAGALTAGCSGLRTIFSIWYPKPQSCSQIRRCFLSSTPTPQGFPPWSAETSCPSVFAGGAAQWMLTICAFRWRARILSLIHIYQFKFFVPVKNICQHIVNPSLLPLLFFQPRSRALILQKNFLEMLILPFFQLLPCIRCGQE